MPVLFQDFRANHYSRRHTVYSKIKRVTNNGYDTSNDFFGNNFTGNILGLTNDSKDFFSSGCNDIIYSSDFNALIACGYNAPGDNRSNLSTFMYSTNNGVSWAFAKDTFPNQSNTGGYAITLAISDGEVFCGGTGGTTGNFVSLMKTSDGDNWDAVTSCTLREVTSIAASGDGEILVSGTDTSDVLKLLLSVDNGVTFTEINYATQLSNPAYTGPVYYINNSFYFAPTQGDGNALVFTITGANALNNGTDINNWTNITGNFSDANGTINLTGFNTTMYYDSDNGNTFILFGGQTSHYVFYSTDGLQFIDIPLNDTDILQATKIIYVPSTGTYYLGVVHQADINNSANYSIMYSSPASDLSGWYVTLNTYVVTNNVDRLKDIPVNGVYDFYLESNTLYLVVTNVVERQGLPFTEYRGLVKYDLVSGLMNTVVKNIGNDVTKMIYSNPNLLVSVSGSQYESSNDTIYYQGPNDTTLQETEHKDDTN